MDFDLSPTPTPPPKPDLSKPSAPADSPIADTTYRNYDGPLKLRASRWTVIAAAQWRLTKKKPIFWVLATMGLLPFLFAGIMLYLQTRYPDMFVARRGPNFNPFFDTTPGQKYTYQFYRALDFQLYFLFPLAILLGSGAIAADNRTNALMVYLSKPLTKGDYLLGKWLGVFLILFGASFVPAFGLYLYALMSDGVAFLKQDPFLVLKVACGSAIPAALFTSLQLGLSAWSKTPRIAGAVFAGIYVASGWIAQILWALQTREDLTKGVLIRHLSISGIINGLNQNLYGLILHWPNVSRRRGFNVAELPPPNAAILFGIFLVIVIGGIATARAKINAVEVVRG